MLVIAETRRFSTASGERGGDGGSPCSMLERGTSQLFGEEDAATGKSSDGSSSLLLGSSSYMENGEFVFRTAAAMAPFEI